MYNEELFIKPLIWFQILKQEAGIEWGIQLYQGKTLLT
jgi:hypothetical protein